MHQVAGKAFFMSLLAPKWLASIRPERALKGFARARPAAISSSDKAMHLPAAILPRFNNRLHFQGIKPAAAIVGPLLKCFYAREALRCCFFLYAGEKASGENDLLFPFIEIREYLERIMLSDVF